MALPTFSDGNVLYGSELNAGFTAVKPPVGAIISWLKTFYTRDSGTTTSTTANKLVQTGQNFLTTVSVGDVVYNTTDLTYAYVTAKDSDTTLSLSADIMTSGEAFTIYATPALEAEWVECNGQTLSDAESRYNGATIPDLNSTPKFLRGGLLSGTTGGSDTHTHLFLRGGGTGGQGLTTTASTSDDWETWNSNGSTTHTLTADGSVIQNDDMYTQNSSTIPAYYQVVFILRIK